MLKLILIFLAWVLGSFLVYKFIGTDGILPYAGVTIAAAALYIWQANRKA